MNGHRGHTADELRLGALADDVAALQRPTVESTARLRQARNRLVLSARALPPARGGREASWLRARRWTPLALAAGAALVIALVVSRGEQPLTFAAGPGQGSARLGVPLRAPAHAPLPLTFSDGTAFTVAPRSQLTVTDVAAQGAGVVLNEGALVAAVVPRARSRWRVQAGPYTVAVTGTRFTVEWHPRSRSFQLTLQEGAVTVFGPSFGPNGRRVTPQETLRAGPEPPPAPPPIAAPASVAHLGAAAPASGERPGAAAVRQAPAARSTWKRLAQTGRYADALAAAEEEGFAEICRGAPATDLLLLGNAARFAQQPERAERAFRAARARRGTSHESAVAAFELGRLSHDVGRRYRDSADWFALYLREEPAGALAHEAVGRRMEALHRAGDRQAARRAAEAYLGLYPDGPHQGLARQLLRM
jgi:ferric-dicitrate binding protein FerR (iron transport regulator)